MKALGGHTEEERFNVIVEQLRKLPKTASVLLLGRYRSDINLMNRCDQSGRISIDQSTGKIRYLEKPDMVMRFMSAQAS